MDAIDRVRAICLALPEAEERETWGDPTFRVRDKIFAMIKRGEGRWSVWYKAAPGIQDALIAHDPEQYFVPPYVGARGWIGIRLDIPINSDDLGDQIVESYRMIAPKRLVAQIKPLRDR